MDSTTQSIGKRKLKQSLTKSLSKLRLSKRGRITSDDKRKIKKTVVSTVQKHLKTELQKTSVKTYDWYFFKENDRVYHIEAMRNNVMHNRYFVVDDQGKETVIGGANSFASTVGQQRVQQFDIASKEIVEIISSSAKLFADMMKITVSEKEDAKIWKAYDTVDEKKIITVTIGLPAAIIGSAEAIPLMVMASKSSAFSAMTSSIGKGFALNTGRQMAINGGLNLMEQYASNGLYTGKWGLSNFQKIDGLDVAASAAFGNWGSVPIKSAFDYNYDDGYKLNDLNKTSENILVNSIKFKGSSAFGKSIGKSLSRLAPSIGGLMDEGGKFTIKTTISSFHKKRDASKKNIQDD